MTTGTEKIAQYLAEARATEEALVRTLQAHIAMTPAGDYRDLLERHLRETEQHRDRVDARLDEIGEGRGPIGTGVGALQSLAGQVLAVGKAPIDVVRGESGEERLLKNAKDESASEALEIATYRALEALAEHVGDAETARLAADIRADEERTLAALGELIPALTRAAADAEVTEPSYDAATTGAADAARDAAARGRSAVDTTRRRVVEAAREAVDRVTTSAREAVQRIVEVADRGEEAVEETTAAAVSGVQETARQAEQAVREAADAARTQAGEAVEQAGEAVEQAGRETQRPKRRTAPSGGRAGGRASDGGKAAGEPWPGYDEQRVADITKRLSGADAELARRVRDYERRHKNRSTVLQRARAKAS